MAIVYMHINNINDKKYVGITKYSDANQRWGLNGEGYKGSLFFEKGISQFGWNNFSHLILNDDLDYDSAQQVEARLIKILRLDDINYGYNNSSGVHIKENSNLDILCDTIIKNLNNKTDNDLILQTEYRYATNQYTIKYLNALYLEGKINTDLDCQRGYTWTQERQQGMWDTLLFGHRIPEFHAVRSGLMYDIIDGKQRITTIVKIINNEIPCKKNYANPKLIKGLFQKGDKSSITFSELPDYLQERILNTSINIAEYSDIGDDELVSLFRKLNASMPLSDFAKGIANHIFMRTDFSRYLISHAALSNIFSETARLSSEDEKMLVRLAILIKKGPSSDLQPQHLLNHYNDFSKKELLEIKDKVLKCLDLINDKIYLLNGWRSIKSYMPIVCYVIIDKNLTEETIIEFFKKIKQTNFAGRGEDLGGTTVQSRYNNLVQLLNT